MYNFLNIYSKDFVEGFQPISLAAMKKTRKAYEVVLKKKQKAAEAAVKNAEEAAAKAAAEAKRFEEAKSVVLVEDTSLTPALRVYIHIYLSHHFLFDLIMNHHRQRSEKLSIFVENVLQSVDGFTTFVFKERI